MQGLRRSALLPLLWLAAAACESEAERTRHDATAGAEERVAGSASEAAVSPEVFEREFRRIRERAASLDSLMQPLPLLRPAEEDALRRFGNAQQLERARALGVGPSPDQAELNRLAREGALVRLADSTQYWVVRSLDHSVPWVTPDTEALLTEIGRRFQARLAALGLPAFRFEISSALRSGEDQARLRTVNPNAVAGLSTHQFGTTVDIAYNAFAPPEQPILDIETGDAPWLQVPLEQVAALVAEVTGARRALELKAILGQVLLGLQNEGNVMVTLEQLQPVFHITIARRLAGRS
jgi:hypothetical protein